MADYLVTLNEPGRYDVGVDYEIPSKSIQYGNIVLGKTPDIIYNLIEKTPGYSILGGNYY